MIKSTIATIMLLTSIATAGIYYTVDDAGNVTRHKGDTPYPSGAIFDVAISSTIPDRQLVYADGVIKRRPQSDTKDANLTEAQIADRNTCLANLASLLADFGVSVPIQPATAMSQMFAYWSAHPEDATLTAKAQQVQFLYTRLRIEYGMTDPQIGGLE